MRLTLPKKFLGSRSGLVILFLTIALIVALAFIAVERGKAPTVGKQTPSAYAMAFRQAATTLFSALPNADKSTKTAHRAMWDYLSHVSHDRLPSEAELKQVLASSTVPYDYEYFFKECLPKYRAKPGVKTSSSQDPNVILSVPVNSTARARLLVNQDNITLSGMKRLASFDKPGSRIAFAGAYSSPFNIPAGLAIMDGMVINPVLQRFDGLLVIDSSGRLFITSIDRLQDGLRPLKLREKFGDYQQFVKRAIDSRLSVIQGTLLVDEGKSVLDENASQRAIPRRIIFTTEDGGIYLYDSLKKSQTLGEVTKALVEKYHAREAQNLETGSNNFCLMKNQNIVTDYGQVQPGTVLSNVVVIDF